ncbi:MAG: GNAT family N-acetyltransferase, partial [Pseudonocardiaceae bacterium]
LPGRPARPDPGSAPHGRRSGPRRVPVSVEIRRELTRYVAYLDDDEIGELAFSPSGDVVTALHTEVAESAEGQGVGSTLARTFLDDIRSAGRRVVPLCPFVRGWIKTHPDYADLVRSGT